MATKRLPGCPVCNGEITVTEYKCESCGITVRGKFSVGPFFNLTDEQIVFVATFLASHGSIKQVESRLGISYPTVKTRLKEINRKLGLEDEELKESDETDSILSRLESGELNIDEAIKEIEKEK